MIALVLLVMSSYVFSRSVQEARADKGPAAALWVITAIVALVGVLYSFTGSAPK